MDGLIKAQRLELNNLMTNLNDQDYNTIQKSFQMAWTAMFMLSGIKDVKKPLRPNELRNTQSNLVKTLIKIYTMESFIVYKLNETSYK